MRRRSAKWRKNEFHLRGYTINLLHSEVAADSVLREAIRTKWRPAVLDFPRTGEQLHQTLQMLAVSLDRDCCLQKVYNDLIEQNSTHHMVEPSELSRPAGTLMWAISSNTLVDEATAATAANVLDFLSGIESRAIGIFEGLVLKSGKPAADNKFLAVIVAAAIENLPSRVWDTAWRLNEDRGFAEIVLLTVAHHRGVSGDGVAAELSASQVAQFYCLLRSLFPDEKDEGLSGTVTPRMAAGYLKNAQIGILTSMASDDACRELLHLAELFPDNRLWFKARYRECVTSKRRKLSFSPRSIVGFAIDGANGEPNHRRCRRSARGHLLESLRSFSENTHRDAESSSWCSLELRRRWQ